MILKNKMPIGRLIAKIDNDFNIDNSDWIPRVGAWVTDALSQMKVLPMERKKRELEVSNRIAIFPCELNAKELKVYDSNGCEIEFESDGIQCNCSKIGSSESSFTGELPRREVDNDMFYEPSRRELIGTIHLASGTKPFNKSFIIGANNQIELNFDTDKIIVESYEVATYFDEYFNCQVPYIYDDGLLLEALAWYCLFKMLSRGYKHQVYSLTAQQQILNPFIQWNAIKNKAADSVRNAMRDKNRNEGWNNFLYNSTFLPRTT